MSLNLRFLICVLIVLHFNCKRGYEKQQEEITIKLSKRLSLAFDSLFVIKGELRFKYPEGEHISDFLPNDICFVGGRYFVVSVDRRKIIQFDSSGNFLGFIGKGGEGPGEFKAILGLSTGLGKNIIALGAIPFKVVIYKYPNYNDFEEIKLPTIALDIVQLSSNKFVFYSLYTKNLLNLLSEEGKILMEVLQPSNEKLKLFSAQAYTGFMFETSNAGFFFCDPISGYIFRYDSALNLICKYVPEDNLKKFFGFPKPYPQDLSPYEITQDHISYWKSFIHPLSGASLNDTLFIVQYYSSKNMRNWDKFSFNLVSVSGEALLVNSSAPHNGMLIFPGGDEILEIVPGELKGTTITEAKIFRYKLRQSVKAKVEPLN